MVVNKGRENRLRRMAERARLAVGAIAPARQAGVVLRLVCAQDLDDATTGERAGRTRRSHLDARRGGAVPDDGQRLRAAEGGLVRVGPVDIPYDFRVVPFGPNPSHGPAIHPIDLHGAIEKSGGGTGEIDLPSAAGSLTEIPHHGPLILHHALVPGCSGLAVVWGEVHEPDDFEAVLFQRLDVSAQREPMKPRPDVLLIEGNADA